MNKIRWAEAFSGLLANVLACAGLVYLLFGQVYSFANSTGTSGKANLLQALQANVQHIQPEAIIAFCILLLGIIGVGVSAVYHSRTRKDVWYKVLLSSVGVMVVVTLLGLLSIGPFMIPGTLFALLALYFARIRKIEVENVYQ